MNYRRIAIVIILTLLPWPAVWFGMYKLSSLVATFFLYHFVCLLPAIIWQRKLWLSHWIQPTRRQWVVVLATATSACVLAVAIYTYSGTAIVSRTQVLSVLTERGFTARWLLPLSLYFVIVNAALEELFWRGVILNELEYVDKKVRFAGTAWTAFAFAAWHWLVLRALLRPGWAELAVLGVVAMGFFTSWLYRKTNSILLPILWHGLVFDLAIIAMFVWLLHQV